MKKVIGIMAALVLMAGVVSAQKVVSAVQDTSVACQVLNGCAATLTIAVSGSGGASDVMTEVITCDGNANTIAVTNGSTTMAQFETAIAGCTNAAGKKLLVINSEPSLAADTVASLAGTYTAAPGKWLTIPWDTSACKHFDLYLGSNAKVSGTGSYIIDSIVGYPGGTGNVTLSIYQSAVLIDQQVIISPSYVFAATLLTGGTNVNTNTFGVINDVNLSVPLNLPCSGTQPIIIRASRVTTATTGVLSAIIR